MNQLDIPGWLSLWEILRVEVGSTLHGAAIEGQDDLDLMGVFIEEPDTVIGLEPCETFTHRTKPEGVRSEPGDVDYSAHSLRKFMRLAVGGNPTIIQLFFAPEEKCHVLTEAGKRLRRMAPYIVSKRAGAAYLGYLIQQRMRMTGERGQKDVKRPELVEKYGFDTKFAMHALRLGFQGMELMRTGRLTFPSPQLDVLQAVRRGARTLLQTKEMILAAETLLVQAIDESSLPKDADKDAVTRFLVEEHLMRWAEEP
jgi:uncharacterized protein